MSNFNSLDLFINHITPSDNDLLKHALEFGIQDKNLNDLMMVEEGTIGWDVYLNMAKVGDKLWQAHSGGLSECLLNYGFSKFFINIAISSQLDGYDMVRFSKDLEIDDRFPMPARPVVDTTPPQHTGDKKKGQIASVAILPGEDNEDGEAALMRLIRVSPDMLSLQFDTPDGPAEIGVELVDGKVNLVVFSPQNKTDMSQLYDATITIGAEGTVITDQQGKEATYLAEERGARYKI